MHVRAEIGAAGQAFPGPGSAHAGSAAKMFEGHPHMTIFPCDAVDVMPLLRGVEGE